MIRGPVIRWVRCEHVIIESERKVGSEDSLVSIELDKIRMAFVVRKIEIVRVPDPFFERDITSIGYSPENEISGRSIEIKTSRPVEHAVIMRHTHDDPVHRSPNLLDCR